MPSRRGTRLWISGVVGLAVVAGVAAVVTLTTRGRRVSEPRARAEVDGSNIVRSQRVEPHHACPPNPLAHLFDWEPLRQIANAPRL